MRFLWRGLAASLVCMAFAAPARAQSGLAQQAATPQLVQPPADSWRVALDAGMLLGPAYLGSNTYKGTILVTPDLRYGDNRAFISFRDGVGATLYRDGGFSLGPVARLRLGRDQDDNAALAGMGNIDLTAELGVFMAYRDGPWRVNGEVRQGLGGHRGQVADLRLDRVWMLRPDVFLTAGPRLAWGSTNFAETYFGVDSQQSQASGYRQFAPSNYWFAGVSASASWAFADRWGVTAFGEVGQIFGPAADSPLVNGPGSPTQAVAGLAVRWRLTP
jgi:outer membrane protein